MLARYRAIMSNAALGGGSNTCDVSFTIEGNNGNSYMAMLVCAYLGQAAQASMTSGSLIKGIEVRESGSAGSYAAPFDATSFSVIKGLLETAGQTVPAQSGYSVDLAQASSPSAPVGTSIVMSERTDSVGRKGIGRHYLPFTTSSAITNLGALNPATIAVLETAYRLCFIDSVVSGAYAVVTPASITNPITITSVIPQPIPSNLRSRRR